MITLPAVLVCQLPPPRSGTLLRRPGQLSRSLQKLQRLNSTSYLDQYSESEAVVASVSSLSSKIAHLWSAAKRHSGRLDDQDFAAATHDLNTSTWSHSDLHMLLPLLWTLAQCRSTAPVEFQEAILHAGRSILRATTTTPTATSHSESDSESDSVAVDVISVPAKSLVAALEATRRSNITDTEFLTLLTAALSRQTTQLDAPWAARALVALAGVPTRPPRLLAALAVQLTTTQSLEDIRPQLLGQLVRAGLILDTPSSPAALHAIALRCLTLHRGLSPSDLARAVWLLTRRGIISSSSSSCTSEYDTQALLVRFAPVLETILSCCTMRELADISRAYAKAGIAPQQLFDAVAARAASCMRTAGPEDVTRVVTSFQQLGLQPDALLDIIEVWADHRLAALSPRALVAAVASFARLGNRSPRLLQTAAACASSKMHRLTAAQSTSLVWAFARLEHHPGVKLLDHAVQALQTTHNLGVLDDRDASNGLWALARLEHPISPEALDGMAAALLPAAAKRFSGHSAALALWAFATLNHHPKEGLVDALAGAVARDIKTLDPQSLSMTSWALGSVGQTHRGFAAAVERDCGNITRINAFEPQQLGNLLWGFAKAESTSSTTAAAAATKNPPLASQLEKVIQISAEVASSRFTEFAPQNIFNVCWALATLRRSPPGFSIAAANELITRAREFENLELSGMLWALGRLFALAEEKNEHASKVILPVDNIKTAAHQGVVSNRAVIVEELLSMADIELPCRAPLMDASEVTMALHGIIHILVFHISDETSSSSSSCAFPASVQALLTRLEQCTDTVTIPSLVSVLEALQLLRSKITEFNTTEAESMLAQRACVVAPTLRSWELARVVLCLTELSLCSEAGDVLDAADPDLLSWRTLAPPRAIELLVSMVRSQRYPEHVFRAARRCLEKLAPTYCLSGGHVALWTEAMKNIDPQLHGKVRMSKAWELQVQPKERQRQRRPQPKSVGGGGNAEARTSVASSPRLGSVVRMRYSGVSNPSN